MSNFEFPASDAVGPPPFKGRTSYPDITTEAEPDTPHPVIPWLTRPRRVWLYGVIGAAEPVLIAVGATSKSLAPLAAALLLSIVGTGVALPNTVAPRD